MKTCKPDSRRQAPRPDPRWSWYPPHLGSSTLTKYAGGLTIARAFQAHFAIVIPWAFLLERQCSHRAKLDAFSTADALVMIGHRGVKTTLFQRAHRADLHRGARMILRATILVNNQFLVRVVRGRFFSPKSKSHFAHVSFIFCMYHTAGHAFVP